MKILKKSLAIFLTLALCLSAMLGCLSVSAEGTALTLVLDKDTYAPGETVRIAVTAADFADIKGAEFQINLGALTDVAVENGAITIVPDNEEVEPNVWVNGSTVKFVDTFEVASGVLFTVVATAPAVGSYEVTVTDAKFGVSATDLADITVAPVTVVVEEPVVECTHEWGDWVITQPTKTETGLKVRTCGLCSETEEVVLEAAKLEPGIEFRNSIMAVAETFQIDFRVRKTVIDALETQYASYKLVVTPQKYNATTLNEETGKPEVVDFALSGKTNYVGTYTNIAMYELGLNLNAYLECYDADGVFVAYSNVYTENPVTLFKGLITAGAAAGTDAYKMNVAVTDALNLAAQAQDYFPSLIGSKTCDLYTATRVNEGIDQQYATATLTSDMLTVVDITNKCNVVYNPDSVISAATNELRLGGAMGAAPSITYDLRQATATGSSPLDYSKLSMTVSYMRATDTVEGAEWEAYVAKKHLSYTFTSLAMYDADKVVTCVVTYDGVEAVTATYTLETFINQYKDDANMGTIITALGKFTTSVRAYFGA